MVRMRRITCDWDFKSPKKIMFFLNRIFKFGFTELTIKKSRKKGFHVFIWTKTSGKGFKLREYFGDDKKHIFLDKKHKYGRQTLFSKKIKFKKNKLNNAI